MATKYVIGLTEASGWAKARGPTLTKDDPYHDGLTQGQAVLWVGKNWGIRHATVEEMEAFNDGTPPIDPGNYTVAELETELRSFRREPRLGGTQRYSPPEIDQMIDAEESGQNRQDILDLLEYWRTRWSLDRDKTTEWEGKVIYW